MIPAFATAAGVDPYVVRQASLCASDLVRRGRFTPDDWGDLRQEMFLDLLQRLPRFRPERGDWQGFVRGVMRNRAATLAAEQERLEPFGAGSCGGNEEDEEDDAMDALGADTSADLELRLDIQRVIANLPEHLRVVALLLHDMTITEICQHTGKSRSGINHFIRQIRAAFAEAGITPERLQRRGGSR